MADLTRYATTHDAAEILNTSDDHVLDLIEYDVLPATLVGGVRVMKLAAVLRLKAEFEAKRLAVLGDQAAEAEDC